MHVEYSILTKRIAYNPEQSLLIVRFVPVAAGVAGTTLGASVAAVIGARPVATGAPTRIGIVRGARRVAHLIAVNTGN